MLHHKVSLGKSKKTENISSIFSDHNTEIKNNKKKTSKTHKHVAAKEHATKQLVDHWRDKKIPKNKWKQKQIFPK